MKFIFIHKKFLALVFTIFTSVLFGFVSPFISQGKKHNSYHNFIKHNNLKINISFSKASNNKANGNIHIQIINGMAPFKVVLYSTSHSTKDYVFENEIKISDLESGEYLIVVNDNTNAFVSENITL
jgi:hypothetical protein